MMNIGIVGAGKIVKEALPVLEQVSGVVFQSHQQYQYSSLLPLLPLGIFNQLINKHNLYTIFVNSYYFSI